jgi:hypothetical protein
LDSAGIVGVFGAWLNAIEKLDRLLKGFEPVDERDHLTFALIDFLGLSQNFFRLFLRHAHDSIFSGYDDVPRPHCDTDAFDGGVSGHAGDGRSGWRCHENGRT